MEGIFFVILILVLVFLVAKGRKWNSGDSVRPTHSSGRPEAPANGSTITKSDNFISFDTSLSLVEARKQIIQFAQRQNYNIEDVSSDDEVVLGESPSLFAWGFFYPIYLSEHAEHTRVDIGVKSKFVQAGAIKSRSHENFANNVKADLWVVEQDR